MVYRGDIMNSEYTNLDYIFQKINPKQIPYNYILTAMVTTSSGTIMTLSGDELRQHVLDGFFEDEYAIDNIKIIMNDNKMHQEIADLTDDLLDTFHEAN